RAARTGGTASRMSRDGVMDAFPWPGRGGRGFVFVATMSLRPPAPDGRAAPARRPFPSPGPFGFLLGESTAALAARLVAALLTAGVLCYGLARCIVSPVVKLRAVTRQVAGGDLSARVGPLLGGRSDELGAMGRDFDAMAARIEALLSAQTRLLRDISHELRSPLARLSVALDLARKRAGPEAANYLARIEREAGRLNEMIGQLLTLSRWEAGAGSAPRQPVDLAALVREVAEDADFEARGQNRAVELVACEACATAGTPALLRSAVENVVRNAVRHTPEGTAVRISLRRARDGEEDDGDGAGRAVLTVRDEGAGVPAEALTEIFRPFYRVDDARDRESGGTGLGLAITERAVRLHGGTVTAENVAGGGFVVEIRLPLDAGAVPAA
ncbi:MAG TPA: ATP-binding protein, partial [Pyrinomonadaceae bacterium]|nr:ATP-binding protein [Pyrinomonadaceae bacterium]